MILILETTTGKLTPGGTSPSLPRGGLERTFLQFVTNSNAALLPGGSPIALRLYQPNDLVNPIATLSAWTASGADLAYIGSFDTMQGGLAALTSATLIGKISYANPNVDSQAFLVRYGTGGSNAGAIVPIVITQPTGPVNYVQEIGFFGGRVVVGQVEGYWRVKAPCNLLGLLLNAQDAPVGANLKVDVVKGGDAQNSLANLTDGQKAEETIFGGPIALAVGDIVQFKPTQVGATKAGTNLSVKAIIQLT